MVWVAEGDTMPEDGKVFSLCQKNGTWVITGKQMLVSFYKNGSKLDWEKTTGQSPAGDVLKAGDSRQGCATDGVKVPCRQLSGSDG
jgi:hypothetical protein